MAEPQSTPARDPQRDAVADDHRPVCPWCGHRHEGGWGWQDGEHDRAECGRPFGMEREAVFVYHTRPVASCPARERLVVTKGGAFRPRYAPGAAEPCPMSRQKREG